MKVTQMFTSVFISLSCLVADSPIMQNFDLWTLTFTQSHTIMETSGEIKRSVFAQGHFNVSQKTGNISHDGDKAWQSYWNTCVICWKLMFHIYPALCTKTSHKNTRRRKTLLYLSWTCCMVHSRESAGCRTRRAGLALSTCHTHTANRDQSSRA